MTTKLEIYPEQHIHLGDLLNLAADITVPVDHNWRVVSVDLIEAVESIYNDESIDTDDMWADCKPERLNLAKPMANNLSTIIKMATAITRFPSIYLSEDQKLELIEAWQHRGNTHKPEAGYTRDIDGEFADLRLTEKQVWDFLADPWGKS